MKKIFTLLFGIVFSITILNAQQAPPQALSFKASITDDKGKPIVNKSINLRISILQSDINGFVVYSEIFQAVTGTSSQVDVEIGRGNVISGNFSLIDWSADEYFLKIEVDVKQNSDYQLVSVTQLLSVPYALFAAKAGNVFSGNYNDLYNNPTDLSQFNNNVGFLTNEADPIFSAHPASGITSGSIANWNTAYSWGNHAGLYKPNTYIPDWTDITSKPTLFDGAWSSLSGTPATIAGYGITDAFDGNWASLINKPAFAAVATSGSYSDLINKPVIDGSETRVISGTNVLVSGNGTTVSPYVVNAVAGGWSLTGNAGTVDGNDFIGTTDNVPFNIRVNNQKAGRIDASGPVFLGYQAGNSNAHINNTGIGFQALYTNTTGGGNVAVGRHALYSNLTGSQNVGIGPNAMYSNTNGNWNTALGGGTLLFSTTGSSNTAVGYSSLSDNTSGSGNSASGEQSLIHNTTGSYNTAHGQQSLNSNRTGGLNVAVGTSALRDNISGSNATAIGTKAMLYANSTFTPFTNTNIAVGYEALRGSTTSSANTGNNNTALGYQTLWNNTSGGSNTATGYQALYSNTTGTSNTALGYKAGFTANAANANTTGSNNTFIGNSSGPGTSTQLINATALGYNAMVSASNSLVLGGTGADAVKVGIGITVPSYTLDVAGDINFTGTLYQNGSPFGGGGSLWTESGGNIYRMSGNVGIGTTILSGGKLTVAGSINITSNDAYRIGGSRVLNLSGTTIQIGQDLVIPVVIPNGNVGIGTSNPQAKLEVAGNVKIVDGTQGAGKVLTSDANGLASWAAAAGGGSSHYIGESYGGGIVFYVYDNGQHGLIASTASQSTGIQWYNGVARITGTAGDGLNGGAMNTAIIVATQISDWAVGNFAAKVCADYSVTVGGNTYGDWYLPSKVELNLLYLQKSVVGGIINTYYWSSSEYSYAYSWGQSFLSGSQGYYPKSNPFDVRAIRAF